MSTVPLNLETDAVALPQHARWVEATLEQAFERRRSSRTFLPDPLPLQTLSTLLWAAFGINRPDTGGRTAPSAHNWQEIEVYSVLAEGAYHYDPAGNQLQLVSAEDLRGCTGTQSFVAAAPLNLVYVADFARMTDSREDERGFLAGVDAGCISQNVNLCCAGMGLATVVRGLIDRRQLAHALGLRLTQRIVLAQTVGYPGLDAG
jgi:SagB-type dehydrogenase family enzyme